MEKFFRLDSELFQKRRLFAGIILLFIGIYLVLNNIMKSIAQYIPQEVYQAIYNFMRIAPQIIVGIAIIVIGIKLIMGKKRGSEINV